MIQRITSTGTGALPAASTTQATRGTNPLSGFDFTTDTSDTVDSASATDSTQATQTVQYVDDDGNVISTSDSYVDGATSDSFSVVRVGGSRQARTAASAGPQRPEETPPAPALKELSVLLRAFNADPGQVTQ